MIKGGYYLKARAIQESEISNMPPHVREIWDWLIMNANRKPYKNIDAGEIVTTYRAIQDGLSWQVGWRKEKYKTHHISFAMKALTKANMIVTTKTTRGLRIKIINYLYYQDPNNYVKQTTKATGKQHESSHEPEHDIQEEISNNNIKKNKQKKVEIVEKNTKLVADMIKAFEESLGFSMKNKPSQERACRSIIKRLGEEKAMGAVTASIACQGKQFAPRIANLVQLDSKLDSLMVYYRNNNEPKTGVA